MQSRLPISLNQRIRRTNRNFDILLEEQTVSLSDIIRLQVGSTLPLKAAIDPEVVLRCGQVAIARGRIGRSGDRLVVRVEQGALPDGAAS